MLAIGHGCATVSQIVYLNWLLSCVGMVSMFTFGRCHQTCIEKNVWMMAMRGYNMLFEKLSEYV